MDPFVIPAYIFAIIIDIAFPLFLLWFLMKRTNVSWKLFLYGAVFYLLFQLPLFLILFLLDEPLYLLLYSSPLESLIFLLSVIGVIMAFLGAAIDQIGKYVSFKFVLKDNRDWKSAMMFGAGWGGIISLFSVIILVISLSDIALIQELGVDQYIAALNDTGYFTQDELLSEREFVESMTWLNPVMETFDNIFMIILHISLAILVLQVFTQKKAVFLVLAVILQAAIGASNVLIMPYNAVISELFSFVLVLIIGLLTVKFSDMKLEEVFPELKKTASKAKKR